MNFSIRYSFSDQQKCGECNQEINYRCLGIYTNKKLKYNQYHFECYCDNISISSVHEIAEFYNLRQKDQEIILKQYDLKDYKPQSIEFQSQNEQFYNLLEVVENVSRVTIHKIFQDNEVLTKNSTMLYEQFVESVMFGKPPDCNVCEEQIELRYDCYFCRVCEERRKELTCKAIKIDDVTLKYFPQLGNIELKKKVFHN